LLTSRSLEQASRSLSDLAAVEVVAGVKATTAGEGKGLTLGLYVALLSSSSSRHRLEQLGALGENTYRLCGHRRNL